MTDEKPAENPEVEALFQASRQVETVLIRERSINAHLKSGIEQVTQIAHQWKDRAEALRKHLADAQAQLQAYAAHANQLQERIAGLGAETQEQARKSQLELTASQGFCEQLKSKLREHEETIEKLKPELERAREQLERVQADLLEREHRYQASVLSYQGRDQTQQSLIASFREQYRQVQEELGRFKSRWLEAERMRQESDKLREEAVGMARRAEATTDRLRELEELNRVLTSQLEIERRQRKQSDSGNQHVSRERETLLNTVRSLEERLAYAEAELSKVSSEAALLKAARSNPERGLREKAAPQRLDSTQRSFPVPQAELDLLEKLAAPGYPV